MQISSTNKTKIIALCGFILVFIGLLIFLFSGENFGVLKQIFNTNATKEQIQDAIGLLGIRAYIVVFVLAMMQVVLTFVPAEPLHVISGMSFGLWKGMAVCFAGILVGNTIVFLLYKFFGKKITDYFATNVEFDFERAKKSKRIALIIILLYCLPAIPYGIICFFAATLGMKYSKYIIVTGIGSIPSLLIDVGLGHITMATSWSISLIVFVVIILLMVLIFKYKKQIFEKINAMVRKSQEKARNKVGKYNGFIFKVAGNFVYRSVKKKVKIKLKNNVGKISKPCVVLCNHGSFYDFIYAGKLLMKNKPHFVVARLYFHHKKLGWLIEKTGAFPKSLMANDIENSRNCFKVVASNGVLAMMPEARLSTVGKFEGIQDATYKLLQKLDVPVYVIKINGAYLAKPKWGDSIRKGGLVEAELNCLFTSEDLKTMSCEEIKQKTNDALYYDEWEWLKSHPEITYNHDSLAVGLENILCVCPNCGEKHSFTTNKNNILCEKCGLNVAVNNRYNLSGVNFENIAQWYEWQQNEFKNEIETNENFCLESEVELRHLSGGAKDYTKHAGNGICKLNKDGLLYIGTDNGKEVEKFFPMSSIYRLLFGAGENFEIYEGKEIYYFVPTDKRRCVMWYIVSGIFHNTLQTKEN